MQALSDSVASVLGEFAEEEYIARTVRFFTDPDSPSHVTSELHPGLVAERSALFGIIKGASASVNIGGVMIVADICGVEALKIFALACWPEYSGECVRPPRTSFSTVFSSQL